MSGSLCKGCQTASRAGFSSGKRLSQSVSSDLQLANKSAGFAKSLLKYSPRIAQCKTMGLKVHLVN